MIHKLGKLSICCLQNKQRWANLQTPFIATINFFYLSIVVLSFYKMLLKCFNGPITSGHAEKKEYLSFGFSSPTLLHF